MASKKKAKPVEPTKFKTYDLPAGRTGHIMVVDNALPLDVCKALHSFCAEAMPVIGMKGETLGGLMPDVKSTVDLRMDDRARWMGKFSLYSMLRQGVDLDALDARVADVVGALCRTYASEYKYASCPFADSGYQLQKYERGEGFYGTHVDGSPTMEYFRLLAVVFYLNTVTIGGETAFPDHGVAVAPVAGRAVIFPAAWTHPHVAQTPVSDDKYIISTFIYPNL